MPLQVDSRLMGNEIYTSAMHSKRNKRDDFSCKKKKEKKNMTRSTHLPMNGDEWTQLLDDSQVSEFIL